MEEFVTIDEMLMVLDHLISKTRYDSTWIYILNWFIKERRILFKNTWIKYILWRILWWNFVFYNTKESILNSHRWQQHTLERKSGIPESTLIPAPKRTTMRFLEWIKEITYMHQNENGLLQWLYYLSFLLLNLRY